MLKLKDIPKFDDVKKLWNNIKNNDKIDIKHKILLGFVMLSGCRISEILRIKRKDIDFERAIVRIRQSKKRKEFYREIIIPKDLLDLIKENKWWDGFDFTRQNAFYIVKKWTSYHPHAFRHSFAIELLSKTKNMEFVRRLLGHSNYNIIRYYLDFTIEDIKEEILKIYD
ncbi:MAG: site-specific integrase [candidate division WOR-3 bacterium]